MARQIGFTANYEQEQTTGMEALDVALLKAKDLEATLDRIIYKQQVISNNKMLLD